MNRPSQTYRRPLAAMVAALLIALPASAWISFADPVSLSLVALLSIVVTTTGLVIVRYRPDRDALTLITFMAAYYFVAFGLGPLNIWMSHVSLAQAGLSASTMLPAVAVATVGWLGLLAGYLFHPFRSLVHARVPMAVQSATFFGGVVVRAIVVYGIGWFGRYLTIVNGTYFHTLPAGSSAASSDSNWFVAFTSDLPTLVTAVVGAHVFMGVRSGRRRLSALFALMLLVEVIWYVPSGSRNSLLNIVFVAGVLAYYGHQRIPTKLLVSVVFVFVFVVVPFGLAYRGNSDTYQSDPGASMQTALQQTFSKDPAVFLQTGISQTLARFSDIESGALMLSGGRDRLLPALHGETLTWIASAMVPRFVVPDKPDSGLFGNEVGRITGMISPTDYVTSISFAQPYEFYFAAGWFGVALGMGVVGAVSHLISDLTSGRRNNPFVLALYAVSALALTTSLGVIVAHGFAGEVKALVVDAVVLIVLAGGFAIVPVSSRVIPLTGQTVEGA